MGAGNGDHGDAERLVRLEERVNHLKDNSATKTDIAQLNGRLDVVLERVGNLVSKDDLKVDRRWFVGTIIAIFALIVAIIGLFGWPNASPADRGADRSPATTGVGAHRTAIPEATVGLSTPPGLP